MSAEIYLGEWRSKSACLGANPDTFFGPGLNNLWKARDICLHCPVFDECRDWGLEHFDELPHGILFGTDEITRMSIDSGLKQWVDWRKTWTIGKRLESMRAAQSRERKKQNLPSKQELRLKERPACIYCKEKDRVNRCGRNSAGRTRWICFRCSYRWVDK